LDESLLEQMETLQNILVSRATGGFGDESGYRELRQVVLDDPRLRELAPRFLVTCRNLHQFWEHVKHQAETYAERRTYIWDAFQPLMDCIESGMTAPSDAAVTDSLKRLDSASVHAAWQRALERRARDPEGAVTAARTLLETTCKHILDDLEVPYDDTADLPKLYHETAKALNIAPSQHTEPVFKQILGGCTSVVEGLGAMRNRLGDSHGKGSKGVRPAPRHAELAVNLAGSMAAFLVATWQSRKESLT
jgi:hypothetical protein